MDILNEILVKDLSIGEAILWDGEIFYVVDLNSNDLETEICLRSGPGSIKNIKLANNKTLTLAKK